MRPLLKLSLAALALAGAIAAGPAAADPVKPPPADRATRAVIFVGNNWEGTADVISPRGDFHRIARLNIIPDRAERADLYGCRPAQHHSRHQ